MSRNGHLSPSRPPGGYILDDYWMALYRRKWMILMVAIAAGAIAAGLSRSIEPRYEARADFYVPQDVVSAQPGPEGRNVRIPGLKAHALVYLDMLRGGDARRSIANRIPDRSASDLGRGVDLTVSSSGSVRVYARDRDPETAAAIANAFVDYFEEFHQGVMQGELKKTLATLDAELSAVQEHKRQQQEEVRSFKAQHQIALMSATLGHLADQKARLQAELRESDVARITTTERLSALELQMQMEDQAYQPSELSLAQSAVVRHLRDQVREVEAALADRSSRLPADDPELQELRRRQRIARQSLDEKIQSIDSLPRQAGTLYARLREQHVLAMVALTATDARAEGLRQAIQGVDEEIEAATTVSLGLDRRMEEIAIAQQVVSKLMATRNELSTQLLRLSDVIIVTQRAWPPSRPVLPQTGLNIAVALIGGMSVGILYVLFLDYLENRPRRLVRRAVQGSPWRASLVEGLARSGHE